MEAQHTELRPTLTPEQAAYVARVERSAQDILANGRINDKERRATAQYAACFFGTAEWHECEARAVQKERALCEHYGLTPKF